LQDNKVSKSDFHIESQNLMNNYKITLQRTSDLALDLRATDNYIDKMLPYEFTKMIGEAMDYSLIRKTERDHIKHYMKLRLRELREVIIGDNGWPNLKKHKFEKLTLDETPSITIPVDSAPNNIKIDYHFPNKDEEKPKEIVQNDNSISKSSKKASRIKGIKSSFSKMSKDDRKVTEKMISQSLAPRKTRRSSDTPKRKFLTNEKSNSEVLKVEKRVKHKINKGTSKSLNRPEKPPVAQISLNQVVEEVDEEVDSPIHKISARRNLNTPSITSIDNLDFNRDKSKNVQKVDLTKTKSLDIKINNYANFSKVRI